MQEFPQRVQDYRSASLVLIFINMLWIFGVIWTSWGLPAVMLAGLALNHAITRLDAFLDAREYERRWPK